MGQEIEKFAQMIRAVMAETGERGRGVESAATGEEVKPLPLTSLTREECRVGAYVRRDVTPPEWIIEDFLKRSAVTAVVGEAGIGKSLLLAQLGFCVGSGADFLGLEAKKGACVLLDMEMPLAGIAGPQGRIARQLEGHDLEGAELYVLNLFDAVVTDPSARIGPDVVDWRLSGTGTKSISVETFKRRLVGQLDEWDLREQLSVLIIDGATEFCGGKIDENAAVEVRALVMALRQVAAELNIAIVILLHTGKGKSSSKDAKDLARGSSAWLDAPDIVQTFAKVGDEDGGEVMVKLECAKNRWGGEPPKKWIRRQGLGFWELTDAPPEKKDEEKNGKRSSGYDPEKFREVFFNDPDAVKPRKDFLAHENFRGVPPATFDRWRQQAEDDGIIERDARGGYRLTQREKNIMRADLQ